MSKVTKQNSMSKPVHKERDKIKSTIKSTSKEVSKEEPAILKRKNAKESGINSIDEKKSEKKNSTSTKTDSSSVKNETKTKSESKSVSSRNGKSIQKVQSDKTHSSSIDKVESKRSSSVQQRPIEKVSSKLKDATQSKLNEPNQAKSKDSSHTTSKESSQTKTKNSSQLKSKDSSQSKDSSHSKVVKTSESTSSKTKTVSKRQAPLKASHAIGAKTNAAAAISSKNVMNLVHNVTVSSPPPVRREIGPIEVEIEQQRETEQQHSHLPRGRTRTRTLEDSEIVILKPKLDETKTSINGIAPESTVIKGPIEIKPPVSFEVMLDDEMKNKEAFDKNHSQKSSSKPLQTIETAENKHRNENVDEKNEQKDVKNGNDESENDSNDYEDDFESYESDFESDVSDDDNGDDDNDEEESEDETSITTGESDTDDNIVSTASKHPFETGHSIDNSEFDSGSFEMKILSARSRERRDQTEPTTHINRREQQIEMQHDSGIENTYGANALQPIQNGQMNSLETNNKTFDNISDIENEGVNSLDTNNSKTSSGKLNKTKSRLAKRGEEILSKITLDVMNYVLFDFKPIPYEVFMKIYGNSNTTQMAVQTHNDRIDQECQSDAITMKTSWSQCPISFYTEHMHRPDFYDYKNGCGFANDEQQINGIDENLSRSCESSLNIIRNMSIKAKSNEERNDEMQNFTTFNVDYESLNRFLLECEMTLSRILNVEIQKQMRKLNEPILPNSNGFLTLNSTFISIVEDRKILRTFTTEALPGFLFTLHRENSSQLNVIAMWNLMKLSSPVCLLSVWSKVLCLEIHPKIKDIVFAGLDDGSIAVWDYSESKFWHPELSGSIKRFVPSQITTPTFDNKENTDFGRCISIRGLPIAADTELLNGYNPKQMCSLHESGLLILWTVLSSTTGVYTELMNKRIDHQSMWSKVKLIQTKAIDLCASIKRMTQLKMSRPTSKSFDKTRSYFESELFSDTALQELHEMNGGEEKILTNFRCTAIELTSKGILISTNENFLLFGRKSFKNESFRRIQIDSNKNVRVECMVTLSGFDEDIVIIALNNGAVKSLCCYQNIEQIDDSLANSDAEESSSSISSLTPTVSNAKALDLNFPTETFEFGGASPSNGSVHIALAAPLQAGISSDNPAMIFGKSCTIQSLVQSERRIYDEAQALNHLENMEYKAPLETVAIKSIQRSFRSTHLMSGQTILNNSFDAFSTLSRQFLVQLMKSKKLIILRKNRLRIYDLITNQVTEVPIDLIKQRKFVEATATAADYNEEFLILLNAEGTVEMHQITVEPN